MPCPATESEAAQGPARSPRPNQAPGSSVDVNGWATLLVCFLPLTPSWLFLVTPLHFLVTPPLLCLEHLELGVLLQPSGPCCSPGLVWWVILRLLGNCQVMSSSCKSLVNFRFLGNTGFVMLCPGLEGRSKTTFSRT